jgi:hypothetical protein
LRLRAQAGAYDGKTAMCGIRLSPFTTCVLNSEGRATQISEPLNAQDEADRLQTQR